MYKKPNNEDNRSKLKYVHLIPHESCPGNFIVLEILPWEIDENNNSVPETTAKRRTTKATKIKKLVHSPGIYKGKEFRNRVISTLQVPEILNAKTSVLWKIYNERRKLKVFSQGIQRLRHIQELRYKRY